MGNMSRDEKIRKATEMAHLLDTHPDLNYDGKLYSEDLLLDRETTEERIHQTCSELRDLYNGNAFSSELNREIYDMFNEVNRMKENPSEEERERSDDTLLDKITGYAQKGANQVKKNLEMQ